MTTPSFYPEQLIREAMERAGRERQQQGCELDVNASFNKYVQNPELRGTPAIWRKLHFCQLGPEVGFDGTKWILGSNICSTRGLATDQEWLEGFGEDDAHDTAFVFDADLEDAAGKLYKIRVLYNDDFEDRHNTGCFGKVFDRIDTSRVYAEILSHGEKTKINPTALLVEQDFVEHEDLAALKHFLWEGFNTSHQFCMIVHIVMSMAWIGEPISSFSAVQGSRFERLTIKLLCKAGCAANSGNLAAQVLVQDPYTDLFAEFLNERRYVSRTRECRDASMDWSRIPWLVRATRLHEQGDLAGAVSAVREWEEEEHFTGNSDTTFFGALFNVGKLFSAGEVEWAIESEEFAKDGPDGIAAFLAHAKPLVFGWDRDEEFCALAEEGLMERSKKRKATSS